MIRKRLAFLALAAGLTTLIGCTSPSGCGWFSRLCGRTRTTSVPVEAGVLPSYGEGPMLADPGPVVGTPAPGGCNQAFPGIAPVQPNLPLAPTPRLVPQAQSQPMPYSP